MCSLESPCGGVLWEDNQMRLDLVRAGITNRWFLCCLNRHHFLLGEPPTRYRNVCRYCRQTFQALHKNQIYCEIGCRNKAKNAGMTQLGRPPKKVEVTRED